MRFVPTWDATLLVHARRTLILLEPLRERIFHVRMPQSIGTFAVDWQVPEFGRALLKELGAPRSAVIQTFTEVRFKDSAGKP